MTERIATLDVQLVGFTVFQPPVDSEGEWIFTPDLRNELPLEVMGEPLFSGEALNEFAGRACYQAWSKSNPQTATNEGYLANILDHAHHSVLEHASVSLYIQGVSRSLTHELVRHRHFSPSQLSQRYVDSRDARLVVPPAFIDDNDYVLDTMVPSFELALRDYEFAVERRMARGDGRKEARQAARAYLPNMTETKLVITANYRAWLEFLIKRDSDAADVEIRQLARRCSRLLERHAPNVFGPKAREFWDTSAQQTAANA
ncbi:thymidylate synthase [Rhodococcus phage Mbo2]|uniref:Thymidylate synthase n=1 Tax=Rhodococcus phage Mbo2 TaxID=2936911 RepID=A0A9E7IN49_9CAUD|nr:thymidylate synthase [Rhodococcus phage Mbo2]